MRSTMLPFLKHTRLCTLSCVQICQYVIPSNAVTFEEVQLICSSVNNGLKEAGLTTICNEMEPRMNSEVKIIPIDIDLSHPSMVFVNDFYVSSKYVIRTKKEVKLISLMFTSMNIMQHGRKSYQCKATVKISRVTDHINNTSSLSPRVIEFNKQTPYGQIIELHLRDGLGYFELEPDTCYVIRIDFSLNGHPAWIDDTITSHLLESNSDLNLSAVVHENMGLRNHLKALKYTI